MAGKAMTKTQVLSSLAESTGLSKGQIDDVIEAIGSLIGNELKVSLEFVPQREIHRPVVGRE